MASSNFTTIQEGTAKMCYPSDQESTVFYNPVQVQNRDLSVLMITLAAERRAVRIATQKYRKQLKEEDIKGAEQKEKLAEYAKNLNPTEALEQLDAEQNGISIFEGLAASGLRSIRYWKEIPRVKHVTINDLDPAAVDRARRNIELNDLADVSLKNNDDRSYGICANHGDATHELYLSRRPQRQAPLNEMDRRLKTRWDIIDLDPYGSAAPFLDSAVQAIENQGMLCVTCTDMAALGGSHPETCFGRYAAMPIQSAQYLQELALRILLQTIATTAAKYGRTIRPILSVGMNFYVRVFVEVRDDKAGVNDLSLNLGHVYQSTQCPSFVIVPCGQKGGKNKNVYQAPRPPCPLECPETGGPLKVGGPFWLGPLHDQQVVETALQRLETDDGPPNMEFIATKDRLRGLLTSCFEELNDTPLFYKFDHMCSTLAISAPKLDVVKSALINAGYRASGYHKDPTAIKTDAPDSVVWDVLRAYAKENPPKKPPKEDSAAAKILSKEVGITVDWTMSVKKKDDVTRFPMNPERHWGPKKAASGYKRKAEEEPNVE